MINFIYNFPIKLGLSTLPINIGTIKPKTNGYISNPILDRETSKNDILNTIQTNPRIKEILNSYGITAEINFNVLNDIKEKHLKNTYVVATKIYMSLPNDIKNSVNLEDLQEAAILHDYGKILIPDKIINKKGRFNEKEREIMNLHPELGYELLKNKGLSPKVLNLIKYHHHTHDKKGYPSISNDFDYSLELQILSLADKYSALREKRSYKNPLAKYEALEIIAKEVSNGNIDQEIYTALIRSV